VSGFRLGCVIVASIVTAQISLELLGILLHLAGRSAGKLITGMIPKPEAISESAAKPDSAFFAWLQGPRK
jgi:hypothetical protein